MTYVQPPVRHSRALVTGASGVLGAAVAGVLASRGWSVRGVDFRDDLQGVPALSDAAVVDLRSYAAAEEVVRGMDVVVHCAGLHAIHLGRHTEAEFFDNNVRATFNLLQAAAHERVRRFVFTSSTAVYGRAGDASGQSAVWVSETTERDWRRDNVYHATKVAGEDLCAAYALRDDLPMTVLRCTRFCTGADEEDTVRLLSQGVSLADAAVGHALAADAVTPKYLVANIGPPTPFRPDDLADLFSSPHVAVQRAYPEAFAAVDWDRVALPPISRVYDITLARAQLGYAPTVSFDSVVRHGRWV